MNSSISILFLLLGLHLISASSPPGHEPDQDYYKIQMLPDPSPYDEDSLSFSYYQQKCPDAEGIISRKMTEWFNKDRTLAASLIRLHFHDSACRGCDASILLDHEGSERSAEASRTLRGFEVIDDIKAEIEKKCPRTVSCADILTAVARDATVLLGGPYWMVPYGRKDGLVSLAKEADEVPMGHESITDLIEFFQSKGLNVVDLTILSGAHTVGRASCGSLQNRIFNYSGTGKPDPSIDPKYLNYLKRKCRWASELVDLDPVTPMTFDAQYYNNIQKKMGLLSTDQMLLKDSRTLPLVRALISQADLFSYQFAVSMVKLGNIQVLTGPYEGEIRINCSCVNSHK